MTGPRAMATLRFIAVFIFSLVTWVVLVFVYTSAAILGL